MDNQAVVQRIMRNLSFDIEPETKIGKADPTSSKSTPLNVKIRVKGNMNKVKIPKAEPQNMVLRTVRLVNSEETILSFDMFMEDPELKKKPRKNMFGLCLGNTHDDNYAYMPEGKSASKSEGVLGNQYSPSRNSRDLIIPQEKMFLGTKCKPGGCLDPPFGEDKYSYRPTVKDSDTIKPKDLDKDKKKDSISSDGKKNDESITIPSDATKNDSRPSLEETKSNSIVTYPTENEDKDPKPRTPSREDKRPSDQNGQCVPCQEPRKSNQFRPSVDLSVNSFFKPPRGIRRESVDVPQVERKALKLGSQDIEPTFQSQDLIKTPVIISSPIKETENRKTIDSIKSNLEDEIKTAPISKNIEKDQTKLIPVIVPIPLPTDKIAGKRKSEDDFQQDSVKDIPFYSPEVTKDDPKEMLEAPVTILKPDLDIGKRETIDSIKPDTDQISKPTLDYVKDKNTPVIPAFNPLDSQSETTQPQQKTSQEISKIPETISSLSKDEDKPEINDSIKPDVERTLKMDSDFDTSSVLIPSPARQQSGDKGIQDISKRDSNVPKTTKEGSVEVSKAPIPWEMPSGKPDEQLVSGSEILSEKKPMEPVSDLLDSQIFEETLISEKPNTNDLAIKDSRLNSEPRIKSISDDKPLPIPIPIPFPLDTEQVQTRDSTTPDIKQKLEPQTTSIDNGGYVKKPSVISIPQESEQFNQPIIIDQKSGSGPSTDNIEYKNNLPPTNEDNTEIPKNQLEKSRSLLDGDSSLNFKESPEIPATIPNLEKNADQDSGSFFPPRQQLNLEIIPIDKDNVSIQDTSSFVEQTSNDSNQIKSMPQEPKEYQERKRSSITEEYLPKIDTIDTLPKDPSKRASDISDKYEKGDTEFQPTINDMGNKTSSDKLSNEQYFPSEQRELPTGSDQFVLPISNNVKDELNTETYPYLSDINGNGKVTDNLEDNSLQRDSRSISTPSYKDTQPQILDADIKIQPESTQRPDLQGDAKKPSLPIHDNYIEATNIASPDSRRVSISIPEITEVNPRTSSERRSSLAKNIVLDDRKTDNIFPKSNIQPDTDSDIVSLDLAFYSYKDGENEQKVKSINTNDADRYPKDSVKVLNTQILQPKSGSSQSISIPIDSKIDLAFKIKKRYDSSDSAPNLTGDSSIAIKLPVPSSGKSTEKSKYPQDKIRIPTNEKDAVINLTNVYERELIPLQQMIWNLKNEVDSLAAHQVSCHKNQTCLENARPMVIHSNKKCACRPHYIGN